MHRIVLALSVALLASNNLMAQQTSSDSSTSSTNHETINLWPKGLPAGSIELAADKIAELKAREKSHPRGHLFYVDSPSLTVYAAPKEKANGCAVVICPGGAYNVLAWRHEGLELAEYFNSIGVTAFVLKYRVPRRIPDKIHWEK